MDTRPGPGAIKMSVEGASLALHPDGALDMETAPALGLAVDTAVHAHPAAITIDLTDVTFIDSVGLRVLVRAYRRSRRDGFALTVVPGNPTVDKILRLTGLNRLFEPQTDDVGPAAAAH